MENRRMKRTFGVLLLVVTFCVLFTVSVFAQGQTRNLSMYQRVSGTVASQIHTAAGGPDTWLFSNPLSQRVRINIQHNDSNSAGIQINPGPDDRYDPTGFTIKLNNGVLYPVVKQNTDIYIQLPAGFNLFEIYSAKYCNQDATYTIQCTPA